MKEKMKEWNSINYSNKKYRLWNRSIRRKGIGNRNSLEMSSKDWLIECMTISSMETKSRLMNY